MAIERANLDQSLLCKKEMYNKKVTFHGSGTLKRLLVKMASSTRKNLISQTW